MKLINKNSGSIMGAFDLLQRKLSYQDKIDLDGDQIVNAAYGPEVVQLMAAAAQIYVLPVQNNIRAKVSYGDRVLPLFIEGTGAQHLPNGLRIDLDPPHNSYEGSILHSAAIAEIERTIEVRAYREIFARVLHYFGGDLIKPGHIKYLCPEFATVMMQSDDATVRKTAATISKANPLREQIDLELRACMAAVSQRVNMASLTPPPPSINYPRIMIEAFNYEVNAVLTPHVRRRKDDILQMMHSFAAGTTLSPLLSPDVDDIDLDD